MISDTSSVVYEFLLLNKPVITYKSIDRKEKAFDISDKSELRATIDNIFQNENQNYLSNKYLLEVNPYLDGNISNRIFTKLREIKENNLFPPKKKPLNLFRKCQILWHSFFKKGYLR